MPVYSTRYNLLHEQETFIVPLDDSNDFEGDVKEVKILVTGFGVSFTSLRLLLFLHNEPFDG